MRVFRWVQIYSYICAFLGAAGLAAIAAGQTQTLRIVTYNIEADIDGATAPKPGLLVPVNGSGVVTGTVTDGGVLAGIGEEPLGANNHVQPLDILALQETTSNSITIAPIVSALNSYYSSPGMYAQSSTQGLSAGGFVTNGNGPNGIVYNTKTLQLVATVPGVTPLGAANNGISRQVMRYEFAPAGVTLTPANEFYVYVSHYKASTGAANEAARQKEALTIRADSATLPADARILYVGDYNVGSSSEDSYQTIVGAGINQGVDPFNPTGATGISWTGNSLLNQKTESSTSLRFRDDFLIMTTNVYNGTPGGLQYISGTYHTFGNNGTTARFGSAADASNTALANVVQDGGTLVTAAQLRLDLTFAADHLPVVADFLIPVPEPSSLVLIAIGGVLFCVCRAKAHGSR